jgi:hypothetical protein
MSPASTEQRAGVGLHAAPTVRLAIMPGNASTNNMMGKDGVRQIAREDAPPILVSYHYIKPFLAKRERYMIRDWSMDSGAYSAFTAGVNIDLDAYIELALELMQTDPQLTEIFALDVIGDWRASLANTERMWAAGVPAIPTYHSGEPEDVLLGLARDYPKIAIGGAVGMRRKLDWAQQCFQRVWPKAIHGLGFGSPAHILALPWHSVDATNWQLGPNRYGRWQTFGNLSIPNKGLDLQVEIEWHARLERRARMKWQKESAVLDSILPRDCRLWLGMRSGGRPSAIAL